MADGSQLPELIPISIALPLSLVERWVADASAVGEASETDRVIMAKHILNGRRRRGRLMPGIRFGEASWDMILDLYVATTEGRRVDISGLCLASAVAPTTATRYVEMLVDDGYVFREADKQDGRRSFIAMQPALLTLIERWLDAEIAAFKLVGLFGRRNPE